MDFFRAQLPPFCDPVVALPSWGLLARLWMWPSDFLWEQVKTVRSVAVLVRVLALVYLVVVILKC